MATKIEVILNGVGSITVEHDDVEWSKSDVDAYASAALKELTKLRPERHHPIGFGAGSDARLEHGPVDQDPTEMGWVFR